MDKIIITTFTDPMMGLTFDEALVKKLLEKSTVFADHFTVEFKSGITIEIEA